MKAVVAGTVGLAVTVGVVVVSVHPVGCFINIFFVVQCTTVLNCFLFFGTLANLFEKYFMCVSFHIY